MGRLYILVFILFHFTKPILGQYYKDTTISKYTLDSLHNVIKGLQTKSRLQQYEIRFLKEVKRVDTRYSNRDSINILFKSGTGEIVRSVELSYKNSRLTDSTYTIFNKDGLAEYKVQKRRYSQKNDYRLVYSWLYSYDSLGRVIVEDTFAPGPISRRYFYNYDKQGKRRLVN